MKTTALSFAEVKNIAPHISEVTVMNGVEVDASMVKECHDFLKLNPEESLGLLINKKNDYTYGFAAQQDLLDLPHIQALAFVVYRDTSRRITELLAQVPRQHPWNMQIFTDYEEALAWLGTQLQTIPTN